jgi:hypothetical protein
MIEQVKDMAGAALRVPCEVYSRIVGYLRPVQDWNEGKQQEFAERKVYAVPHSVEQGIAQEDRPEGD